MVSKYIHKQCSLTQSSIYNVVRKEQLTHPILYILSIIYLHRIMAAQTLMYFSLRARGEALRFTARFGNLKVVDEPIIFTDVWYQRSHAKKTTAGIKVWRR